jgi:glycosyltransferase involved in cell wall biosynthesis
LRKYEEESNFVVKINFVMFKYIYPVTVIITTYNSSAFICDTIESVLNQTFANYELLIGDDESTDNTCGIIETYHDPRIRIIHCKHNFIHTQNRLLEEAKGKYIARIDHDDKMLPDRLKIQFDYMEAHPEIDALGGGMQCFGIINPSILYISGRALTLSDMLKGNYMANPTVMIRRKSIEKFHIRYEQKYIYADDYRFWTQMIRHGLHIENIPIILTEYRLSEKQASTVHHKKQAESILRIEKELKKSITRLETNWAKNHSVKISYSLNQLTLILPFYNDGSEVINTVASARKWVGNQIDIMVINDHSYDNFSYRDALTPYHVIYLYNVKQLGIEKARDKGIKLCKTPFFLVLDSSMEFYNATWLKEILSALNENSHQLLCVQSRYARISAKKNAYHMSNVTFSCGKYPLLLQTGNRLPAPILNYIEEYDSKKCKTISHLLGSGYATSVEYWKRCTSKVSDRENQ